MHTREQGIIVPKERITECNFRTITSDLKKKKRKAAAVRAQEN